MSDKTIGLEVIDKGNNKYTVKIDKPVCSKIKFSCIKIVIAILVFSLLPGIVPVAMMVLCKSTGDHCCHCCHCCHWWHCCFCGETEFCNLEIVISVALVLLTTIVTLIFTAKALKPFAKMVFLGEIINNDIDKDYLQSLKDMELRDLVKEELANQRDLIKKYCDTLAEL